jgi:hypothetical protein
VIAVAYTATAVIPSYKYFFQNFEEKWLWKVDGFDDPAVRRKAYESCRSGLQTELPSDSTPFPREESAQLSNICSQPGWVIGGPVPAWWEIPVAYLRSVGLFKVIIVAGVLGFGPWPTAFLTVCLIPTALTRMLRWLRTQDDM